MAAGSRKPARRKARQARSQETVAAILEGSAQVLLEVGYARATTNRIAERAGVSVGSIYQYFDDKDRVFEALIRRETAAIASAVTRAAPDPAQRLEHLLEDLLRLAIRASPRAPALVRELDRVPDGALRRAMADARAEVVRFLSGLLEARRSHLSVDDPDLAARLVVGAAEGIGLGAGADEYGDDRFVAEVSRMFSRYLTSAA